MNNLLDTIELQDLAKGYVVIKENNEVIIEGFNTIVNTGRSFILSKIANSAFNNPLELPEGETTELDYSGYKFYKAYLCENSIEGSTAPVTTNESTISEYKAFIDSAKGSDESKDSKFALDIMTKNITYDIKNRDLILKFDISGNYSDDNSRVISSIILTINNGGENGNEVMFSRFTFDPKVITGNALIQINYHIHF